tara:strand:+ start:2381 stop:3898 length:1518 start_codon:yes stop_codon:yes gene_type:complete
MKLPKLNALTLLTGAKVEDNNRVLLAFFSLFCLLSSYYFIKPLRKGFYFSEFSADLLPYFHLGVITLIIITTAIMVRLYKTSKANTFTRNFFVLVTLINVSLGLTLLTPNKLNVACFCLWSSVYFPLSLALFWGGLNQIFDKQSSKSSYAFIWIGAILGGLCGSYLTKTIIVNYHWGFQFLLSTIFMLCAIFSFEKINKSYNSLASNTISNEFQNLKSGNIVKMIRDLFKNRYLASLAVIILSLTFSRGVFDLQSDAIVEKEISLKIYRQQFWNLNQLASGETKDDQINTSLFEFIFKYKNLAPDTRREVFDSVTAKLNVMLVKDSFDKEYEKYRKAIKREITLFNSEIWTYQNLLSLMLLLVCKINIIAKIGVAPLIMCLPITYVSVFLLLFTPIGLMEIFILKIVTLALDYSVNNTAKEILYVPLGQQVNIGYKPIIEGPLFKLGAASSSVFKIILDNILHLLSLTHMVSYIFIASAGLVAINWSYTAKSITKRFNLLKSNDS